jgi:hypothetical protein
VLKAPRLFHQASGTIIAHVEAVPRHFCGGEAGLAAGGVTVGGAGVNGRFLHVAIVERE